MLLSDKKKKTRVKNLKEFTDYEKNIVLSLTDIASSSSESELSTKLEEYDFLGAGYFAEAWSIDSFVIKLSKSTRSAIPKIECPEYKYFIPTIEFVINDSDEHEINYDDPFRYIGPIKRIIFQKKADTKNKEEDARYFFQRFPDSRYDLHSGNVGKYKGRPIIFDC